MRAYYAIFFCLAITLHNIEEALWLPQWSQLGIPFLQPVAPHEFYFAILVITLLAYVISFLTVHFPSNKLFRYAFVGFLGAMLINTFLPHLLLTLYMQLYAPGLLTALLLIVPVNGIILYTLWKERVLTVKELIGATVVVGVVLVGIIPVLYAVGALLI